MPSAEAVGAWLGPKTFRGWPFYTKDPIGFNLGDVHDELAGCSYLKPTTLLSVIPLYLSTSGNRLFFTQFFWAEGSNHETQSISRDQLCEAWRKAKNLFRRYLDYDYMIGVHWDKVKDWENAVEERLELKAQMKTFSILSLELEQLLVCLHRYEQNGTPPPFIRQNDEPFTSIQQGQFTSSTTDYWNLTALPFRLAKSIASLDHPDHPLINKIQAHFPEDISRCYILRPSSKSKWDPFWERFHRSQSVKIVMSSIAVKRHALQEETEDEARQIRRYEAVKVVKGLPSPPAEISKLKIE
ncbi:hypothetical protein P7C73_g3114, partial [Tremellales sp. Uapishka_1]